LLENQAGKRLSEPDNIGPEKPAAGRATRRDVREGGFEIFRHLGFFQAAELPDVAVKLEDVFRPRPAVQAVDILGDENKAGQLLFPSSQDEVTGIGLSSGDNLPAPVIPFPDQNRVALKSLGCGQVFGPELFPQAVLAAKSGDAGLGRDPRASENGDPRLVPEKPGDFPDLFFLHFRMFSAP